MLNASVPHPVLRWHLGLRDSGIKGAIQGEIKGENK
jgi:hypothetical protein